MAGQKRRTSRMSNGGRKKANLHHEEVRQAKFAAKRGTDKEYKYEPIKYEEGTNEYNHEKLIRSEKAKSSKCEFAQWKSFMAKVQNDLDKQALENKKKFERPNKK